MWRMQSHTIIMSTPEHYRFLLWALTNTTEDISLDYETLSAKRFDPAIVGASFGVVVPHNGVLTEFNLYMSILREKVVGYKVNPTKGIVQEVRESIPADFSPAQMLEAVRIFWFNESRTMTNHNCKYEIWRTRQLAEKVCPGESWEPMCSFADTMMAAHIAEEGFDTPAKYQYDFKLKRLVEKRLKYKQTSFSEVCPIADNAPLVDPSVMGTYAADDTRQVRRLAAYYDATLDPKKKKLWHALENAIVPVLAHMEYNGVALDLGLLRELDERYLGKMQVLEARIHELLGTDASTLNPGSGTQMSAYMFDQHKHWDSKLLERKLNYKNYAQFERKNPTNLNPDGLFPVDRDVMNDIIYYKAGTPEGVEVAKLLLQRRTYKVMRSTFTQGLLRLVRPSGRIHPNFFQAGTVTGRLSCKAPNLMNIPKRISKNAAGEVVADDTHLIRNAFIAPPGKVLIGADYSQLEMRLLAHVTQDPLLLKIFINGEDPHQAIADAMGVSRAEGKTYNYASQYGAGAKKIARTNFIPEKEAAEGLKKWHAGFAGVQPYYEWLFKQVFSTGAVASIMGRTRSFRWHIAHERFWRNMCKNFPIQSFAADIIKIAMRNIFAKLKANGWLNTKVRLLLQVHDELLFEVDEDILTEAEGLIIFEMQNAVQLSVPLLVDSKHGRNWGECH